MNKINISSIREKALKAKKIEKQADTIVMRKLAREKKNFLQNFDSHPVTQEILGGNSASNSSNTLGGKGNLFTFIGFPQGSNPIESLKKILLNEFNFRKENRNEKKIKYSISYPSIDKIRGETPMPWENGRSWVEGIEKGISGLSYYLFKKSKQSRSGNGIQSDNKIKSMNFKKVKYLSEIIEKFKKDISK
jgi:hypothetical protein